MFASSFSLFGRSGSISELVTGGLGESVFVETPSERCELFAHLGF